jgi:hypothetical protein
MPENSSFECPVFGEQVTIDGLIKSVKLKNIAAL